MRWILLVLLLPPLAVQADGYDYIRGDDIYEEDYHYGLDYDGLSSVPQAQTRLRGGAGQAGDSAAGRLKQQARELQQDTTQPSMTRELQQWDSLEKLKQRRGNPGME